MCIYKKLKNDWNQYKGIHFQLLNVLSSTVATLLTENLHFFATVPYQLLAALPNPRRMKVIELDPKGTMLLWMFDIAFRAYENRTANFHQLTGLLFTMLWQIWAIYIMTWILMMLSFISFSKNTFMYQELRIMYYKRWEWVKCIAF